MARYASAVAIVVVVAIGAGFVFGAASAALGIPVGSESSHSHQNGTRSSARASPAAVPTADVIAQSTNLTSDLFAPNLTIEPGVVLDTAGHSIVVSGTFDNEGIIATGAAPSGPLPESLGGSGGGAQSLNFCSDDQNGTPTLASGGTLSCSNSENGSAGASALAPALSPAVIGSWYESGIQNHLAGGSGGAVQGYIPGGAGSFGLYIQAETIVAGTIDAEGAPGQGSCSGIGLSGGGGGGTVLLAYGQGIQSPLNVSLSGGAPAPSCNGVVASGAGGSGQLVALAYGTTPPVNVTSGPNATGVISWSQTLTSNLIAPNLTIEPGVVVATNGYSILVSGTFDNEGTLVTGAAPAETQPESLGGSGGGAQSLNFCESDENGTSTQAPGGALSCSNAENGGPGASPKAPSLSGSEIGAWFSAGMQSYLAGGEGGAVQGYIAPGAGANGLYVQARTILAGSIVAAGGAGGGTCSGIGLSGGGGGGAVILAYGSGVYGRLDLNASGGLGAPSCNGVVASGSGGSGQLILFPYGTSPPVMISSDPTGNSSAGPGGASGLDPPTGLSAALEFPALVSAIAGGAIGAVVLVRRSMRR